MYNIINSLFRTKYQIRIFHFFPFTRYNGKHEVLQSNAGDKGIQIKRIVINNFCPLSIVSKNYIYYVNMYNQKLSITIIF